MMPIQVKVKVKTTLIISGIFLLLGCNKTLQFSATSPSSNQITTNKTQSVSKPFRFAAIRNADAGARITSETIQFSTLTTRKKAANISVKNGEISVNGAPFSPNPVNVKASDTITLRVMASKAEKGQVTSKLLIENQTIALFSVITNGRKIGLNFNEQVNVVRPGSPERKSLDRLKPSWVRGFVNYFNIFDRNSAQRYLKESERINNMIDLHKSGYKVALNIKFDFSEKGGKSDRAFPKVGTPAMENYKRNLQKLYDRVWDYSNIIVVGNEPFIESRVRFGNSLALLDFYKTITNFTLEYRRKKGSSTPIYFGAFNNIQMKKWRNKASLGMLTFVKNNPEIAGVDLHIHHTDYNDITQAMSFIDKNIAPHQKMIITEYSLMRFWRTKLNNNLSKAFVEKYPQYQRRTEAGAQPWKVYEYLDSTLKVKSKIKGKKTEMTSVTRQEWLDFVKLNPWYQSHQNYLAQSYKRFTKFRKFNLGFYAFRQSYSSKKPFEAKTDPWILNGIYVNRTVKLHRDGTYPLNARFHMDFARLR